MRDGVGISTEIVIREKKIVYACGCSRTLCDYGSQSAATVCKEHGKKVVKIVNTEEYVTR